MLRIDPAKLDEVLHPTIDPKARPQPVAKGLPASPGAAIGKIVFTANAAEEWAQRGETRAARPHRHLARGHPRHEGRGRHPDRARRE